MMPKVNEYPNLRTHTRKGSGGQVWTYYYYDGRTRGVKDVPLGTDYAKALEGWARCQENIFPTLRANTKLPKARRVGKRRKFPAGMFDVLPAWGKTFYLNAERRADEDRRPFRLTVAELLDVIERADGRCEVSGIALNLAGGRGPHAPSVDRIDSERGYEKDNIRIVCLIVNFAMNTWGEEPLMGLAEALWRNRVAESCGNVQQAECGLV
jgi:hypothetical protein